MGGGRSRFVVELICSRCGRRYRPEQGPVMCDNMDLGRLDVVYDYEAVKEVLGRETIASRPVEMGVWRYWELMPASKEHAAPLREGWTPLIFSRRLNDFLGTRSVYLKDETRNPTGSFKDRAMAVGVAKAVELGKRVAVTASSGNAASSLAAYCASSGISCYAFVPEDVSLGKAAQLITFGAKLFRVRAVEPGKDPTVDLMVKAVRAFGWYPCPSFGPFNPYQVEGPKTVVYELVEQLGWKSPDAVLVPTGSGCFLTGLWKGLRDLMALGILREEELPMLIPVQPEGNQQLVRAINAGIPFERIQPEPNPRSVASGLLDPFPWDGDAAIEGVKKTRGKGVAVPDEEIMDAVRVLASKAGVFAEPSGAVGLAALRRLLDEGFLDRSDRVVVLVTGSGLKEVEKLLGGVGEVPLISPEVEELRRHLS
ncbi:MAG: threonine synthase [Aigarchaeota archaeon]|nr:threonine synthase [Candidatus Calditenuis fumarioli]